MNFAKNKKIEISLLTGITSFALLVAVLLPSTVFAGDPTIATPTRAICVLGTNVGQVNLNIESEGQTCIDQGGKIIRGGEAVPVPICIIQTGNVGEIEQISPTGTNPEACKGGGGYVIEAGVNLPKLLAPDDPSATGPGTTNDPATCGGALVDKRNTACDVAEDCKNGDISKENCGITRYLMVFINVLSGLVGITVVLVMVMGGIQYSTSAGDPQAAAAAKKRIGNAILALVAFALMYGFLQWIVPGGVL